MTKRVASVPVLMCLSACSQLLCTNETVTSLESPDGERRAILFMRECGATTDYSTQVSVVSSWWPFHDIGNAFVADAYDVGAERGSWGGPWAHISWQSPKHLLVTYDARSRVFARDATVNGVRVTYRAVRR